LQALVQAYGVDLLPLFNTEIRISMLSDILINDVLISPKLKKFGRFILSHTENKKLPDYKAMDLMQIPSLDPDIWGRISNRNTPRPNVFSPSVQQTTT
jgi:hypothetical protein